MTATTTDIRWTSLKLACGCRMKHAFRVGADVALCGASPGRRNAVGVFLLAKDGDPNCTDCIDAVETLLAREAPPSGRVFLRDDADLEVDLFDAIVTAEERGNTMACTIMRVLDDLAGRYPKGVPFNHGAVTLAARDAGWFEDQLPSQKTRRT